MPEHSLQRDPFIVGRDRERERLHSLLDAAKNGQGSLTLVSGEAGIGKTTLIRNLSTGAANNGWLVLRGGCYDLTTTPPYGPWIEAFFRSYKPTGDLPEIPETMRDAEGLRRLGSQGALFLEVDGLVADIAEQTPLLILLEDLHWVDEASVDLLRFLARQLSGRRLLIVATYREDEVVRGDPLYGQLPALLRESPVERVMLRRLDQMNLATLVEQRYTLDRSDRERLVDYLLERSDGNPFYAGELLQELEESRVLRADDDHWLLAASFQLGLPPLLQQTLDAKLDRLDPVDQERLHIAATIGHVVSYDVWKIITSDEDDATLASTIEAAVRHNVLTEDATGTGYEFSHALLRDALYSRMALPRRRSLHRQIAEALERESRPDPDELSHHYARASDERAAHWLIRAGERAQHQYAWLAAVERYQHAIDLLRGEGSQSGQLGWLLYRIGMLLRASDRERGLQSLSSAEVQGHASDDALLVACSLGARGLLLCQGGMLGPGLAKMRAGVSQIERISDSDPEGKYRSEDVPESLLPRADDPTVGVIGPATLSEWLALAGYYREAIELGEAFIGRLDRLPTEKNVAPLWAGHYPDVFQGLSVAYATTGHPELARTWSERAQAEYLRMGHLIMVAAEQYNLLNMVIMGYGTDRVEERRELARKLAASWQQATTHRIHHREVQDPTSVLISLVEGDWQRASANAAWWATQAGGVGFRNQATVVSGRIAHYQGRFIDAWEQVRKVLPEGLETPLGSVEYFPGLLAIDLTASLALDQGDLSVALPWLELHEKWLAWAEGIITRPTANLHWAQYWLALNDLAKSREHATEALGYASDPRQPLALLACRRFLGYLDTIENHLDDASEHLTAALELADACAAPFERALTLVEIGRLRMAKRDRDAAREALDEAQAICEPLLAQPTLNVIAELLAAIEAEIDDGSDAYGLSPRELEVLRLLVDGRTDREIAEELFISPRTAMSHVANIRNKLGVDSRTAATAIAIRESLV